MLLQMLLQVVRTDEKARRENLNSIDDVGELLWTDMEI